MEKYSVEIIITDIVGKTYNGDKEMLRVNGYFLTKNKNNEEVKIWRNITIFNEQVINDFKFQGIKYGDKVRFLGNISAYNNYLNITAFTFSLIESSKEQVHTPIKEEKEEKTNWEIDF